MQTKMTAVKPNGQATGTSDSSLNNNRSHLTYKQNVRTTDYRIMVQILLTNPYSVSPEEFVFLQKVLGFQYAVALMEEGKKRRKLEKVGR